MLLKIIFSSSKPYAMTAVYITIAACVLCLFLIAKYLAWFLNGTGEQSDENKKMIQRENEMLMSRMIDYSENKNQHG